MAGCLVSSEALLGCGVERVLGFAGPLDHKAGDVCLNWPTRWRAAMSAMTPTWPCC